ncbi:helicase [Solibacillus sp. FSL R5-0691]|uniref:helicase n=1 Tax=Solibacillus sp. FSL R5-0691 TaxID=2921653 RepID=UPI0030D26371
MRRYPDCPVITKSIVVGGLSKADLIQKLQQSSISLNQYGERLLYDDRFTITETAYSVEIVELSVRDLGFPNGATLPEIFRQANELGLQLCPPELGPYLRLEYVDQDEGNSGDLSQKNEAPSGSVTIASELISNEESFPKGFYVRKVDGILWLRGYVADNLHVWNPDNRFVFKSDKLK